jgi:hypothetical protein
VDRVAHQVPFQVNITVTISLLRDYLLLGEEFSRLSGVCGHVFRCAEPHGLFARICAMWANLNLKVIEGAVPLKSWEDGMEHKFGTPTVSERAAERA